MAITITASDHTRTRAHARASTHTNQKPSNSRSVGLARPPGRSSSNLARPRRTESCLLNTPDSEPWTLSVHNYPPFRPRRIPDSLVDIRPTPILITRTETTKEIPDDRLVCTSVRSIHIPSRETIPPSRAFDPGEGGILGSAVSFERLPRKDETPEVFPLDVTFPRTT